MLKVSSLVQYLALGFKNKIFSFVPIVSSWWLIHAILLIFANAHMPLLHLLVCPLSVSKKPILLFSPYPHLNLCVNYQAVQFGTSL
jgi:hypothetical protein